MRGDVLRHEGCWNRRRGGEADRPGHVRTGPFLASTGDGPAAFEAAYERSRISVKSADALAVIERVRTLSAERMAKRRTWQMNEPPLWRETRARAEGR